MSFFKFLEENKLSLYLALVPLSLYILIFSPGLLSPDSEDIYRNAVAHMYADHHPPLMAYLWHYLDLVIKGPRLMFYMNLLLLWGTAFTMAFSLFPKKKNKYLHYFSLLLPLIPHVAVYAGFIWKDLIFTFGYGLISVFLALKTKENETITPLVSLLILALAFYTTSVKFQAQFILPFLVLWYMCVQTRFQWMKSIVLAIPTTAALICSIHFVNEHLVTSNGKGSSNSWKYVKIYDLSGMSIRKNEVLVPRRFHNGDVTIQNIKQHYTFEWEPLIVESDSPFRRPESPKDLDVLLETWKDMVAKHPILYFHHRFSIWSKGLLFTAPGHKWLDAKLGEGNFISQYIMPLSGIMAFIFLLPFQLYYFVLGIKGAKNRDLKGYAYPLLFISSMGTALLLLLSIFSLAAVPRYIYFTNFMFMLSFPFAVTIFLKLRKGA